MLKELCPDPPNPMSNQSNGDALPPTTIFYINNTLDGWLIAPGMWLPKC